MSAPVADDERVIDLADVVSAISAAPDPAAVTAHLVTLVASRAPSAAEQGRVLDTVKSVCERTLKLVRQALLDSIDSVPGTYEGFVVYSRAGRRTIDYDKLRDRYPAAYDDLVRVGDRTTSIKYTA